MSDRRYVVARCKDYFTGKNGNDNKLAKLFDDFPETTILLIVVEGQIDKRLKPAKKIKEVGEIINLKAPRYRQLDNWIISKFKNHGKKVNRSVVQLLEEMFSNNLEQLENEIEKVSIYTGDKDLISLEDIQKIISRDRYIEDNMIFKLVDALSERNEGQAIILLNDMMKEGEAPLRILAMVVRQVRLLLSVKELKNEGKSPDQIAKILGEHPYPVKKCYRQCDNFSEEELEIMLEKFLKANYEIVTGKYKDSRFSLELAMISSIN